MICDILYVRHLYQAAPAGPPPASDGAEPSNSADAVQAHSGHRTSLLGTPLLGGGFLVVTVTI